MMNPSKIQQLIETQIPNSRAIVQSPDGIHFEAIVISSEFENKTKVQQQQLVYKAVYSYIQEGSLHALSLKTYTPELWEKNK
ncbi:MAG: hypothetical protein LEGION0398_MBIBDBAK_00699 [Legionellaceae bacterium]